MDYTFDSLKNSNIQTSFILDYPFIVVKSITMCLSLSGTFASSTHDNYLCK